jgi:hypothetical protein
MPVMPTCQIDSFHVREILTRLSSPNAMADIRNYINTDAHCRAIPFLCHSMSLDLCSMTWFKLPMSEVFTRCLPRNLTGKHTRLYAKGRILSVHMIFLCYGVPLACCGTTCHTSSLSEIFTCLVSESWFIHATLCSPPILSPFAAPTIVTDQILAYNSTQEQ